MEKNSQTVQESTQEVTVIGAGVIGVSWTALFLANGLKVCIHDTAADTETRVLKQLKQIQFSIEELGYSFGDMQSNLCFEPELSIAVSSADVIQENGPDHLVFKRELWQQVEQYCKPSALLLSSSSRLKATSQSKKMKKPDHLLVGHPFNPPHIIPLVEVVPGKHTCPEAVERAMAFYRSIGKHPVLLRKEVPGFVANRLQAALFQESVLLVKSGVVTVDELDEIVKQSIGLRWATGGPFLSFHLGGGDAGFAGYLKHFARGHQLYWLQSKFAPVRFSNRIQVLLLEQIGKTFGKERMEKLKTKRDRQQISVLCALEEKQL